MWETCLSGEVRVLSQSDLRPAQSTRKCCSEVLARHRVLRPLVKGGLAAGGGRSRTCVKSDRWIRMAVEGVSGRVQHKLRHGSRE